MELFSTLGVNWMMLLAQLINFGILLAALTVLVYRPVLKLLDERRERVRKSMDDAARLESQVKEMEIARGEKLKSLDAEAKQFLDKAKEQAEHTKKEILADAQKQVEELLAKGKDQLASERTKMLGDLQSMVTRISVDLAGRIIQREFSDQDQKKLLSSLEKDLPSLIK